jgi:hypothetical protein
MYICPATLTKGERKYYLDCTTLHAGWLLKSNTEKGKVYTSTPLQSPPLLSSQLKMSGERKERKKEKLSWKNLKRKRIGIHTAKSPFHIVS